MDTDMVYMTAYDPYYSTQPASDPAQQHVYAAYD
jgi:hypothetical protein